MNNEVGPLNIRRFPGDGKSALSCPTGSCQPVQGRLGRGPVLAFYTAMAPPELASSQKQALATDKPQSAIKENEGCYPLWGVKGCVGGTATISEAQAPSRCSQRILLC